MLDIVETLLSIFLISIIFLKTPKENVGLSSFTTKNNLLGSPSSAQRSLNILIGVNVLIYFEIAFQLNLNWLNS